MAANSKTRRLARRRKARLAIEASQPQSSKEKRRRDELLTPFLEAGINPGPILIVDGKGNTFHRSTVCGGGGKLLTAINSVTTVVTDTKTYK